MKRGDYNSFCIVYIVFANTTTPLTDVTDTHLNTAVANVVCTQPRNDDGKKTTVVSFVCVCLR